MRSGDDVLRGLFVLLMIVALIAHTSAMAQVGERVVRVAFEPDTDIVVGQPLLARLTIDNGGSEPIEINLGHDREGNIRLDVKQPDGSVVETARPSFPPTGGLSRFGLVSVGAGQMYTQQLVLGDWVQFQSPGDYTVVLSLVSPVRTTSGRTLNTPGKQTFQVHVGASDEARLREVCEHWARLAIHAATYEDRSNAALALSQVASPEAVEPIDTVIDASNEVDRLMIAGLERIGTFAARSVLLKMATSPHSDRARAAFAAAQRFRFRQP